MPSGPVAKDRGSDEAGQDLTNCFVIGEEAVSGYHRGGGGGSVGGIRTKLGNAEYMSHRGIVPETRLKKALLHDNAGDGRRLSRDLERLSAHRRRALFSNVRSSRAFQASQHRKKESWKREDRDRLARINIPALQQPPPSLQLPAAVDRTRLTSTTTREALATNVIETKAYDTAVTTLPSAVAAAATTTTTPKPISAGVTKQPRPPSVERMYSSPRYSGRPRLYVPILPVMVLRSDNIEIVRHREQTYVSRMPSIVSVPTRRLMVYDSYRGKKHLEYGEAARDERFVALTQSLSATDRDPRPDRDRQLARAATTV